MKCEKCDVKLNSNNYCPICGKYYNPSENVDESDTSAYFAKYNEMQARQTIADLPKNKKITIGSSKIDARVGFVSIAIFLIVAFFIPFYYITIDVWEIERFPYYTDEGEASGGIGVNFIEVLESVSGNTNAWLVARNSPNVARDMFWGFLYFRF